MISLDVRGNINLAALGRGDYTMVRLALRMHCKATLRIILSQKKKNQHCVFCIVLALMLFYLKTSIFEHPISKLCLRWRARQPGHEATDMRSTEIKLKWIMTRLFYGMLTAYLIVAWAIQIF